MRIEIDRIQLMMRQSIDASVHAAMERLRPDEQIREGDVHHIACAAAEIAIEQFAAYCNSELRLIRMNHELRDERAMFEISNHFTKTMPYDRP